MLKVQSNASVQRVFAWSGIAMMVLFGLGFWAIAGYVPPTGPGDSVDSVVSWYDDNTTAIHLGLWVTSIAAVFCGTFFTAISMQLRRIEGQTSPLAFCQMIMGALFVIEFIIPLQIWQAADYRPTLNPEMTYRLHDLGWFFFLGVVTTAVLQAVLIGWAILRDEREEPIFPRWVGYTNLWCALLFMPGGLIVFFKSGPLDWRGIISLYALLAAFTVWIVVMCWALLKRAIPDQERELGEVDAVAPPLATAEPAAAAAK
jgi:hypothetical protein